MSTRQSNSFPVILQGEHTNSFIELTAKLLISASNLSNFDDDGKYSVILAYVILPT